MVKWRVILKSSQPDTIFSSRTTQRISRYGPRSEISAMVRKSESEGAVSVWVFMTKAAE